MVICKACGVRMDSGKSCKHNTAGRIKYGEESHQAGSLFCRDCGVMKGGYHHKYCCVEECGTCGGQALICRCNDKGGGSIA